MIILVGIMKVFRDMRRGVYDEETLEHHLANRGLMNRILRPIMKSITKPGQMYGVGLLFGLGFDTATEVSLLVLAAAGAASALPWYGILALPILFAAGMCLFDTIDGTFMNFAYGWAFSRPVRKVFYNITITSLSIMIAAVIGGVELLGLLSQQLNVTGRFWTDMQNANINTLGFVIVGLFVVTWAVALLIWRFGHIEEKWTAGMRQHAIRDANGLTLVVDGEVGGFHRQPHAFVDTKLKVRHRCGRDVDGDIGWAVDEQPDQVAVLLDGGDGSRPHVAWASMRDVAVYRNA